jgi:hypothetical protein
MISVSKFNNYCLETHYYYFSVNTAIVFSILGLIYYSILAAISTTVVAIIESFGRFFKV